MNKELIIAKFMLVFIPAFIGAVMIINIHKAQMIDRVPASSSAVVLSCNEMGNLLLTGPLNEKSFFNYYRLIKSTGEQSLDFESELVLREKQAKRFVKKLANNKISQIHFEEDLRELLQFPKNGPYRLNEEIVAQAFSRGLKNFLEKSEYTFKSPSTFRTFFESIPGEMLKNIFFNSGIFWGYPPVYFKGFSPQMIPDELLWKAIEDGPTPAVLEQIRDSLKRQIGHLDISFDQDLMIERLRKNITFGAQTLFVFMVMKDAYSDYQDIEEFDQMLVSLESELGQDMQSIQALEEQGFNLFGEEDVKLESLQCRAYRFCLSRAEDSSSCEQYRQDDENFCE